MPMPVFNETNDLIYLEISDVFCIYKCLQTRKIIVTSELGEYYLPSTIEQINAIMEPAGFMQIDKNRIINVRQVKSFVNGEAHVDGSFYTVSRRNRSKLKRMLDDRN